MDFYSTVPLLHRPEYQLPFFSMDGIVLAAKVIYKEKKGDAMPQAQQGGSEKPPAPQQQQQALMQPMVPPGASSRKAA